MEYATLTTLHSSHTHGFVLGRTATHHTAQIADWPFSELECEVVGIPCSRRAHIQGMIIHHIFSFHLCDLLIIRLGLGTCMDNRILVIFSCIFPES